MNINSIFIIQVILVYFNHHYLVQLHQVVKMDLAQEIHHDLILIKLIIQVLLD